MAALNGWLDVAKALVERGADVNLANSKGSTPLLAASANGKANIVEYLAKAPANKK
jgi:ankyrin repeat protein